MRDAPIGVDAVSVPKPRLLGPVTPPNYPIRICQLQNHNYRAREYNRSDGDKLGGDEKVVESRARFGADGVSHANASQHKDRQQFVLDPIPLPRHARGRVDALDEDDAQDCQCGWHDRYHPGPGREKAEHVAKDVL